MMKKIGSLALVVAMASTALAHAQTTTPQLKAAAFDRTAIAPGGRALRTSGPLGECPSGDRVLVTVTVKQGIRSASGTWNGHRCTGTDQRWMLTARLVAAGRLHAGIATGHARAVVEDAAGIIQTRCWSARIKLT